MFEYCFECEKEPFWVYTHVRCAYISKGDPVGNSQVAERLGNRASNLKVASSIPGPYK